MIHPIDILGTLKKQLLDYTMCTPRSKKCPTRKYKGVISVEQHSHNLKKSVHLSGMLVKMSCGRQAKHSLSKIFDNKNL
jgi:hypothetical protein